METVADVAKAIEVRLQSEGRLAGMSGSSARTVVQAIEDAAASTKTGYRFIDESSDAEPFFSHAGIERASARYGGALQALGARKGDRVALILPDNADFVFAFLGAIRAGIVPVPIYPPTGLGKLAGYLDNTLHIVAQERRPAARHQRRDQAPARHRAGPRARARSRSSRSRAIREHARGAARRRRSTLDDTAFLQFTSGSTSRPKGVDAHAREPRREHARASWSAASASATRCDAGVSWLPLYHDMGLIGFVLAPLYHVNTITFLPPLLFLKRPGDAGSRPSRATAASISFGPNFAYALCVKRIKESEIEGLDLSSWRVAGCGAEPIRAENLRAFAEQLRAGRLQREGVRLLLRHGRVDARRSRSASCGEGVHDRRGRRRRALGEGPRRAVDRAAPEGGAERRRARRSSSAARAFPEHDIQVFATDDDASERPLPEREVGEIRLRGPSVMSGYFNDPELTREAFAGGWLRTGDLGYLAGGNVHICGRSKEVIIVNGRNYYPQDMEWEAGKVDGRAQGQRHRLRRRMKPQSDRERVVIASRRNARRASAERAALKGEVRRAVQQALGPDGGRRRRRSASGVLPKTSSGKLQRAKTRELYETGALLGRGSRARGRHRRASPRSSPRARSATSATRSSGARRTSDRAGGGYFFGVTSTDTCFAPASAWINSSPACVAS